MVEEMLDFVRKMWDQGGDAWDPDMLIIALYGCCNCGAHDSTMELYADVVRTCS
jgi:hypothetical protein